MGVSGDSSRTGPGELPAAALRRLPRVYSLALRLHAAGVDEALLGDCLEVEREAVGPLLAMAKAKLAAVRAEADRARQRQSATGGHDDVSSFWPWVT